jgi:hypothetical protein
LGIAGLFSLLFRRTRLFFLFVGMYLVHIWFFIQYRAFDLDVFFIPAHLIWAIFLAFGLNEILIGVCAVLARIPRMGRPSPSRVIPILTAFILFFFALPSLFSNWTSNDFSQDTAINDFYAGVWTVLPQNSTLVTQAGVFGYDAFYWQLVYQTRPDVLLPLLPGPNPSSKTLAGHDLYATTRALSGNQGPGALPSNYLDQNLWTLPVLLGQQPESAFGRRESLVLYHLTTEPPALLETDPHPQFPVGEDLGPVQLIGFDLSTRRVESGDILFLKFYWRLKTISSLRVETRLGELPLEQHEIGFGLLTRYAQETQLSVGSVVSDSYWLVIPSNIKPGSYGLTIQSAGLGTSRGKTIDLAVVEIINETGTMERWLQIAGK